MDTISIIIEEPDYTQFVKQRSADLSKCANKPQSRYNQHERASNFLN